MATLAIGVAMAALEALAAAETLYGFYKHSAKTLEWVRGIVTFLDAANRTLDPLLGLLTSEEELQFEKVSKKLMELQIELKEVKSEIKWNTVKVQLGEVENSIEFLNKCLQDVHTFPDRQAAINEFVKQCNNKNYRYYSTCLYDALTSDSKLFSDNLLEAGRHHTENDMNKMNKYMKSLHILLVQAMMVDLAYVVFTEDPNKEERQKEWETRMAGAQNAYENMYKILFNHNFHEESGKDLYEYIQRHADESEEQFNEGLYSLLSEKYEERQWATLTVVGNEKLPILRIFFEKGHYRKGPKKNVMICSTEKYKPRDNEIPKSNLFESSLLDAIHMFDRTYGKKVPASVTGFDIDYQYVFPVAAEMIGKCKAGWMHVIMSPCAHHFMPSNDERFHSHTLSSQISNRLTFPIIAFVFVTIPLGAGTTKTAITYFSA